MQQATYTVVEFGADRKHVRKTYDTAGKLIRTQSLKEDLTRHFTDLDEKPWLATHNVNPTKWRKAA